MGEPFRGPEVTAAWVAPVRLADGTPAVLKVGLPHFEVRDEIAGLRFWNGDGAVRLLDADGELNAMLLERCDPGTHLRRLPEPDQDVVLAGLLRRLWRRPPRQPFRPLAELTAHWTAQTLADEHRWPDPALNREGPLAIDPKAFVGDPAYDATQHLFNCEGRLWSRPRETIRRMSALLDLDAERVHAWVFARAAAEPRAEWREDELALARTMRG